MNQVISTSIALLLLHTFADIFLFFCYFEMHVIDPLHINALNAPPIFFNLFSSLFSRITRAKANIKKMHYKQRKSSASIICAFRETKRGSPLITDPALS